MMKTKSLNLLILIAGMSLFAGCSKDDGVSPDDPNALRTIKLSVEAKTIEFDLSNRDHNVSFPTDLYIDWGDGSTTSSNSHAYSVKGTYNVTIQAKNLKWFGYSDYSDRLQQIDVKDCNSLVGIDLHDNDLTSLDVSGLTALEYLNCNENDLTSLDVKGCSSLEYLACYSNDLSTLNLKGCSSLEYLDCRFNGLTSLDVSGLAALEYLACRSNDLSTLNLKGCSALKELGCSGNDLTTLDVSGLAALESLNCGSNDLSAEALNQIFKNLPQGKTFEDKYGNTKQSTIDIYGNPGKDTCDKSIAEKKGWEVRY